MKPLPGAGLPDLTRARAFVATAEQAVTYGAGTWHAPMVALGEPGTALDFVVVQFANGVDVEDCQLVYLDPAPSEELAGQAGRLELAGDEGRIWIAVPRAGGGREAKL